MIKRILLGLGGTTYTPVAIQRAVGLAKRFEAEITGVTVVDLKHLSKVGPVPVGGEHAADKLRRHRIAVTKERIEEAISKFESACAEAGIKYQVKREERKDPFDLMISLARYNDLMIFGLRSLFEHGISVEEPKDTLVRLVSAGVRPIIAVSDEFRPIQKAMIAYSGSMESAKTMKRFIQLSPWPDVKLKIVNFQHSEDKARQLLYDASEYCRAHGFVVEIESNPGSPKDFLLPMATLWQADMIVMGNSARNLMLRRLIGETALHIIRNADRPLFLCQ
ncbi:MAG TPA: universal stress protein [Gammaproteobacteria bacterium]|nr:universal stress protein [Gammaproteobacteria bacterium]HDZ78738.1 universal stress protein [Gammaproteobacteria bacterium]